MIRALRYRTGIQTRTVSLQRAAGFFFTPTIKEKERNCRPFDDWYIPVTLALQLPFVLQLLCSGALFWLAFYLISTQSQQSHLRHKNTPSSQSRLKEDDSFKGMPTDRRASTTADNEGGFLSPATPDSQSQKGVFKHGLPVCPF